MIGRVLLIVIAALCVVTAALTLRTNNRCETTVAQAARFTDRSTPQEGSALATDTVDNCSSGLRVAAIGYKLNALGKHDVAVQLARALVDREPGNYIGWFLLGSVEGDKSARGRAAISRAHTLNPRVIRAP